MPLSILLRRQGLQIGAHHEHLQLHHRRMASQGQGLLGAQTARLSQPEHRLRNLVRLLG